MSFRLRELQPDDWTNFTRIAKPVRSVRVVFDISPEEQSRILRCHCLSNAPSLSKSWRLSRSVRPTTRCISSLADRRAAVHDKKIVHGDLKGVSDANGSALILTR